jgi:DNA repair protein RecO (recombination protein O)
VSVIEAYPDLRRNLDRVLAAGTMVEVIDAIAQEEESSLRAFLLLQRGLAALDAGPRHPDVVAAFLLKAADVVGVAPAFERCAGCGRSEGLTRFSFAAGGALCEKDRTPGAVALRPGLTGYLARLARSDLATLPEADTQFSGEAMGVTRRFIEYHLDRRIKSLAVDG